MIVGMIEIASIARGRCMAKKSTGICVENAGERAVRFVTGRAICYDSSAIPVSGLPSCPETVSPEEVTI